MSGRSKWAIAKHKEAANDAKCTREWARMIKSIEVAARTGGSDPAGNPTPGDMIKKAKRTSVPNDNIKRTRKHGSGEKSGGADWGTIVHEDYAPGGVVLVVKRPTNNRNHAASDMRSAFSKNNGNMANNGAVAHLFEKRDVVELPGGELTEDDLLMAVFDAGAEGVNDLGEEFKAVSTFTDLMNAHTAPVDTEMGYDSADQGYRTSTTVALDADGARKLLRLIDALKESDDVQNIYPNTDIGDEVIAEFDDQAFVWRRFR